MLYKYELIYTECFILAVDDSDILSGTWYYTPGNDFNAPDFCIGDEAAKKLNAKRTSKPLRVHAYYPLTSLRLYGLDLLPKIDIDPTNKNYTYGDMMELVLHVHTYVKGYKLDEVPSIEPTVASAIKFIASKIKPKYFIGAVTIKGGVNEQGEPYLKELRHMKDIDGGESLELVGEYHY